MSPIYNEIIKHALDEGYKISIRDKDNNHYNIKPKRLDDVVVYGVDDNEKDVVVLVEDIDNVNLDLGR